MSGGAASRNLKSVYSSLSNEELPVTISKNNFVSAPFECFNLGKNVHLSRFTVLVSLFASENYNNLCSLPREITESWKRIRGDNAKPRDMPRPPLTHYFHSVNILHLFLRLDVRPSFSSADLFLCLDP